MSLAIMWDYRTAAQKNVDEVIFAAFLCSLVAGAWFVVRVVRRRRKRNEVGGVYSSFDFTVAIAFGLCLLSAVGLFLYPYLYRH